MLNLLSLFIVVTLIAPSVTLAWTPTGGSLSSLSEHITMLTDPVPAETVPVQSTYDCTTATGLPQAECEALVSISNTTADDNFNTDTDYFQRPVPSATGELIALTSLGLNGYQFTNPPEKIKNVTALAGLNLYSNAPSSGGELELLGQIGGETTAVFVEIDRAYIGEGPRLVILDISNPAIPTVLGKTAPLPAMIDDIYVSGNYAYIANERGGMRIVDVTNPSMPVEVGALEAEWTTWPHGIFVEGNYAYTAAHFHGLRVIDISDPTLPLEVGFYDTPGFARAVAVKDNYAYVADGYNSNNSSKGLRIIDISDPTTPFEIGIYTETLYSPTDVAIAGNYAYLADQSNGLRIIDISNPVSPTEVGAYDTPGYAYGLTVVGNYVYVADGGAGLQVLDVSNSTSPTVVGAYDTPGNASSVATTGNYAYIADRDKGLRVVSIANTMAPSEVSFYDPTDHGQSVAVVGNYAYSIDQREGLQIVDTSDPTSLSAHGDYDPSWYPSSIAVTGNYAYITDGSGLRVIDVSDPDAPSEVNTYVTPGTSREIVIVGKYAYVADSTAGLRILDLSSPTTPVEIGFYDTPGIAYNIAVFAQYAYIADGTAGLRVLDISNPAVPIEVGFYDTPELAPRLVAVAGNYAYIANASDTRLRVIDVSNPISPVEVGVYSTLNHITDVAAVGNYVYIAVTVWGIELLDMSNPAFPTQVAIHNTYGYPRGVTPVGCSVYIADDEGGLYIVQFTGCPGYTISGSVTDADSVPLADVTVSAGTGGMATTDSIGYYMITDLITGTYSLIPAEAAYTFIPSTRVVNVPPNTTAQNFTVLPPPPVLTASPSSIPADGATQTTLTLSDAPPNHRVRFLSDRPGLDTIVPSIGMTDDSGALAVTVRSSTSGPANFRVQDLTTQENLPASTRVTFTGGAITYPSTDASVDIAAVRPEHPLDARYLEGMRVLNDIDAIVDWKGASPGNVNFIVNGDSHLQPADFSGASYTLNMGSDLRPGKNTLRIIAYSAEGGASLPRDYELYSVPMPVWMAGLQHAGWISLPALASGDWGSGGYYEVDLDLFDLFDINAPEFGIPGTDTSVEFGVDGAFKLPMDCTTSLEGSLSGGLAGEFGLLGTQIGVEGFGGLEAGRTATCGFQSPEGIAGWGVDVTQNIVRKPVLVMVTYFNPAVGTTVDSIVVVLHLQDTVAKLGEFYIDGKVHLDSEAKFAFEDTLPYIQFRDLELGGGLGIEGGFRADIEVVEVKVWAGADGSIKFVRMGPLTLPPIDNWEFDNITLKGEVGAKFRALWFEQKAVGQIKWVYPPESAMMHMALQDLEAEQWTLIGHSTSPRYTVFNAQPEQRQAFAPLDIGLRAADLAAQTTVTSVLVSNVYTYTEPSLAVNPNTDEALLLWVHDDVAKPVGQAHEINFSTWDGSTWHAPDGITDDNLLDAAPQVAWAGDGNAVAVWERLTETLPLTATWDVTTAKKVEIATAVYSPTIGEWSSVASLTSNDALDLKPQLARNGDGNLLAAWRQNPSGLLGGDADHPDRILTAFYDGDWTISETAVADIPGLVDLAVGYGDNAALLAYTRYLIPTGHPTPTLQLFTTMWDGTSWSTPTQRTDDALGHRNPQVVYSAANQPLLVWQAGDELRLRNMATDESATLRLDIQAAIDTFRIVQDVAGNLAAVFTAQGSQRDLYLAFYDQAHNLWGRPRALTQDTAAEVYPSAGLDSTGRLLMSYASTAMHSITRTTTLSGTDEIITYTVPTEDQTDLMTLAHVFNRNLTLHDGDLAVSDAYPAPGDTVVLSATVGNSGDLALDDVSVTFYRGNPTTGGTLIAAPTLSRPLAAGFTETLTTSYTLPVSGTVPPIYALADPANAISEVNESDNTTNLEAFGPDLEISDAGVDYWGGKDVGLKTAIRNLGASAAPTSTVGFYRDALTGTLIATDTVPTLAAGEGVTLTTPWNFGALSEGVYPLVAIVNRDDFTETVAINNVYTFTLDVRSDLMVNPNYLWTTPLTATEHHITVTVFNVGPVTATDVSVAFYRNPVLLDTTLLFTRTLPELGPAQTAVITQSLLNPVSCGVYVLVDPNNTLTETTRTNNLASTQVENGVCSTFQASPLEGGVPLTVDFTDTSSGAVSNWHWDFGDGVTSTLQHPTHTYTLPSSYTVKLTAGTPTLTDTLERPDYIQVNPCQPLTDVGIAGPVDVTGTLYIDTSYIFTAVITPTEASPPVAYTWAPNPDNGQDTANVTYTWATPGTRTITLTAENCGGSVVAARHFDVEGEMPGHKIYLPLVLRNS
jgi:PKD repeat protein